MADWDADDFEPDVPATVTVPKVTDKWDGEDEDDDVKEIVKDDWEASSEEEDDEKKNEEEDTPEARLAAKMKQQRLAEEGDRELFKDLVGGVENNLTAGAIDNMMPETREEFEDFGKKVA